MKAWAARDSYHEGVVVFAATRGRARQLGAAALDADALALSVTRAPEFDALTAETLTTRAYLERGWQMPCDAGCERWVREGTAVFDPRGGAYCSERCRGGDR